MRRWFVGEASRKTGTAALLIAMLAAAGGCSGDASEPEERIRVAEASEPAAPFAKRMAKLLETTTTARDCAHIATINARSKLKFRCPAAKELRESMASFKISGAEQYGTGAVIDYRSGAVKDNASIVLFVSPDRNWAIGRFGLFTEPSVGTSDEGNRAGYRQAAEQYLEAIRERDCDALLAVAFDGGGSDGKTVCDRTFSTTRRLAKRLDANPATDPQYRGGNGRYGFFTLATTKPKPARSTISVLKTPAEPKASYLVLDVASSPTVPDRNRLRRALERQQTKPAPADTEPSSKPVDSPAP